MAGPVSRDIPKVKISKENLTKTLQLFRNVRRSDKTLFYIGTLFLALTAVTSLFFPKLLGSLVDGAFQYRDGGINAAPDTEQLKKVALGFVYLFIAQAVFSFFRIWIYVRVAENLTFNLRNKLFKAIIHQPMSFFGFNRSGDLLSRFSADIAQIQDTFTSNIAMFLRQLLVIIGGIIYIFVESPKLGLWMLATIPVMVILSLFFGKYIRNFSKQVQTLVGENNVVVEESITGIANVKSFTNENFEQQRYEKNSNTLRIQSIARGLLRGAFSSFIIICLFGSFVFLIFLGLNMVRTGEIQIGELISFMMVTGFVGGSIGGMAEQFVQIQKTVGAVDRVLELIDTPTELSLSEKAKGGLFLNGNIQFNQVGFSYPTRDNFKVLEQLNLTIEQGKTLAIVGPSGAGKSTVAQLLYRFYEPVSGNITLNGTDVKEIDLFEYRKQLAMVPQEVILFGGSIFENIAYGNPEAGEEEIYEAAKKANAHDFIDSFPEKYKTLVGDRGIKLSGGQRQRIAIARAILRNPSVLILDEATSSLDTDSEHLVQQALAGLMKNRTSIVIAHRLSTIRHADQIVVLKAGKVAEQGNHETLMQKENGIYRTMVEKQIDPQEFWGNDVSQPV